MLTARRKYRQLGVDVKNAAPPEGAQLGRPDGPLDVATACRRYHAIELRAGRDHRGNVRDDVRAAIEHALTGSTSRCTCCGVEAEPATRTTVLVTSAHGHDLHASLCVDCARTFEGVSYLANRAWIFDACGFVK